jgi:hypothetical protein
MCSSLKNSNDKEQAQILKDVDERLNSANEIQVRGCKRILVFTEVQQSEFMLAFTSGQTSVEFTFEPESPLLGATFVKIIKIFDTSHTHTHTHTHTHITPHLWGSPCF